MKVVSLWNDFDENPTFKLIKADCDMNSKHITITMMPWTMDKKSCRYKLCTATQTWSSSKLSVIWTTASNHSHSDVPQIWQSQDRHCTETIKCTSSLYHKQFYFNQCSNDTYIHSQLKISIMQNQPQKIKQMNT